MKKIVLIVLVLIVVITGVVYTVGSSGTEDPTNGEPFGLSVPVIVTPSLQLASGQVVLYKATNVSEGAVNFRLMLYGDDSGVPSSYKDFTKVGPGRTVSYVHRPPTVALALGDVSVEAPQAVRATFAPIPTDDPGAIRRIVANVQIMRIQNGTNGPSMLEAPIVVPVSHCNFEPRSTIPYLGGNWYWNCAPDMYPLKPIKK